MKTFIILLPYMIIFYLIFKFLKRNGLFSVSKVKNEFYSGVMTYQEIKHKNRLGGLVRNPINNILEPYNSTHPLWNEE